MTPPCQGDRSHRDGENAPEISVVEVAAGETGRQNTPFGIFVAHPPRGTCPSRDGCRSGPGSLRLCGRFFTRIQWEVVDMGISRTTTERQLKLAKDDLAGIGRAVVQGGSRRGGVREEHRLAEADAKVRQIQRRLRKIGEVEDRDAEAERVKAEKLAAPKVKKEKVKAKAAPKKEKAEKGPAGDKAPKPKKEKSGK